MQVSFTDKEEGLGYPGIGKRILGTYFLAEIPSTSPSIEYRRKWHPELNGVILKERPEAKRTS